MFDLLPDDIQALVRLRDLQLMHKAMQEAEAAMEQVNEDVIGTVLASFCAKELLEIEAKPPRIFGTWSEITDAFKTLGADAKTLAKIKALRREAVERHSAIRKKARGEPLAIELTGWVDQTQQNQ